MDQQQEVVFNLDLIKVLRNKNFLKVWISQVLSQVTTHLVSFALILKIYGATGSSLAVATIMLAYGIPAIFFALFGGAYVDRFSRKKILVLTNFLQAAIILLYIFVDLNIPLIFTILFVYSFINQFYFPAEGALIPCLVSREEILAANSLYMFTFHLSFIAGFAAASPVVSFLGGDMPFLGGSLMLALAGVAALLLPKDNYRCKEGEDKGISRLYKGIFADIKECWRFIIHSRDVALPMVDTLLVSAMISILAILSPAIATDIAGIPLANTGFLIVVPAAVGMLIGTMIIGGLSLFKSLEAQKKLVRFGTVMAALTLIIGAYSGKLVLFLGIKSIFIALPIICVALSFLIGMAGAFILTPARTVIYESTEHHIMGRVLSVLGVLITIASTLPVLLAGAIVDMFSVVTMLSGLGFFVLIYNFVIIRVFSREK